MYRSIRATVVAATALSAAAVTTLTGSPAHAAKPEPVSFSGSFIGGSADEQVVDSVVAPDGSTYLAMFLHGGDFPADPGGYQGDWDGLVVKLKPNGSTVDWATTVGGSDGEDVRALALGPDGDLVLIGSTDSMDFPTTPGAFKSANTLSDGYVTKLDGATGAIEWSTLIGGTGREEMLDVTVGPDNRVWVVGDTQSWNYPTTELADGTFQGAGEAILSQFSPTGALQYSTMYGAQAFDVLVAVDFAPDGSLYAVGQLADWTSAAPTTAIGNVDGADADLLRWSVGGAKPALEHVTRFGGEGNDTATALGIDPTGAVIVAGYAWQSAPPLVNPFQDQMGDGDSGFIAKLDPATDEIIWSTLYGGSSNWIYPMAIRTDAWGNTYIGGQTKSTNSQELHAVQDGNAGGTDGFVAKVAGDGRLVFSTYVGGAGWDGVGSLNLDRTGVRFGAGTYGPTFAGLSGVSGGSDGVLGHLTEIAHVTGIKGKATTKDRTPTFSFKVDLVGAHTQCKVDGGSWKPCSKTTEAKRFTSTKLKPGKHVVRFRALSGPGRTAPVATKSFQVTR